MLILWCNGWYYESIIEKYLMKELSSIIQFNGLVYLVSHDLLNLYNSPFYADYVTKRLLITTNCQFIKVTPGDPPLFRLCIENPIYEAV